MTQVRELMIPGAYELQPVINSDQRGCLIKSFDAPTYAAFGLTTHFAESYYSVSRHGVLRGLHFQCPPHDFVKVVYCISGTVMDAILDLRHSSPTYGKYVITTLSSQQANLLYIPPGLAHGFYVMSDEAVTGYLTTKPYAPPADSGVLWNSAGIPWPDDHPIISARDGQLLPLAELGDIFS